MDLRTLRPEGKPWNFELKEHRNLARHLILTEPPDWVIASPPCTVFSILNLNVNYRNKAAQDKEDHEAREAPSEICHRDVQVPAQNGKALRLRAPGNNTQLETTRCASTGERFQSAQYPHAPMHVWSSSPNPNRKVLTGTEPHEMSNL